MKIINFIICDDIRQEQGNKVSLMGVYDDKIMFSVAPDQVDAWPKPFSFAVFLRAVIEADDLSRGIKKMSFSVGQEGNKQTFPPADIPPEHLTVNGKLMCVVKINNYQLTKAPLTSDIIFFDEKGKELFSVTPDFPVEIDEAVVNGFENLK